MMTASASADIDAAPKEAVCSIDALIIAPGHGLMIVGWLDDLSDPLSCIRIITPDWRVAIDSCRFIRVRRTDVENALGSRARHSFGFFVFLHFDRGGQTSGPVTVELWQEGGNSTIRQCAATVVEAPELRDIALAHIASASFFGNTAIEAVGNFGKGLGAELINFNKVITNKIVRAPYVERFGPQHKSFRGSIIVCLYGKPEFYFVQTAFTRDFPVLKITNSSMFRIARKWLRRCCAKRRLRV